MRRSLSLSKGALAITIALGVSGLALGLPQGALAQMTLLGVGSTGAPAGGGGPAWTPYTSPACYSGGFTSSLSFTVGVGTGVVVFGVSTGTSSATFSSPQLGGHAPTGTIGSANGGVMYYFDNTGGTISGSTASFTATSSAGFNAACAWSGLLTGLNSATPTSTPTPTSGTGLEPFSGPALTVNSGGIGVIVLGIQDTSTSLPLTWTSATRDSATEAWTGNGNGASVGAAHMWTSATPMVQCNDSSCNYQYYNIIAGAWR